MAEETVRLYEGMFLMSAQAGTDVNAALEFVRGVLERARCQIIALYKWDERKLAYTVAGQKRGTYVLAYFNAPAHLIANIERDCNLSDEIARCLIVKAEHFGDVELEQVRQDAQASADAAKVRSAGEGDKRRAPAAAEAGSDATAVATADEDAGAADRGNDDAADKT